MPPAMLLGWEPSPAAAQLRRRSARSAALAKQEQPRGAGAYVLPARSGSGTQGVAGSSWEAYWSPELFLCKADIAQPRGSSASGKRLLSARQQEDDDLEPHREPPHSLDEEGAKVVLERPYPLLALPHMATALMQQGADACGRILQEPRPAPAVTASAVAGSFLLGLHHTVTVAAAAGSVPFGGVASATVVALGSATCLASLGAAPTDGDSVALCPWTTLALACFCSFLAPLPLAPLPKTAIASLVGPVRLALPGAVGAVVMFELGHRHWSRIDGMRVALFRDAEKDLVTSSSGDGAQGKDGMGSLMWEHWWRHFGVRPSGQLGIGCAFLAADLSISYFATHVDLLVTQWRNIFFNSLQAKDVIGFRHQLWDFLPLALASTLGSIYGSYLTTMWDLRWREELTHDFVGMWLGRKSYYYSRFADQGSGAVDNFDQRIVEDTAIFVSNSRALLSGAAGALIRLLLFFPALVRLAPSPMVWQLCLALSVVSSAATHLVGRNLSERNAALQRTEADFRTAMMRTRMFAESIALQQSEAAESAGAMHYFESIKAATWLVARSAFNLSTFTSAYGLAGGIFPFLVLVPYYFHGDITLGLMFQIEGIVGGVRQSLDFFIGAYGDIAVWQAAGGRLLALEACAAARPQEEALALSAAHAGALRGEGLAIATQGGALLLEDASFEWRAGDRVLLTGSPGSGKSALLRSLAGAWPPPLRGSLASAHRGSGVMMLTSSGFLLPHRATLRRSLTYPEVIPPFDEDLQEALASCGLASLAGRLDEEADWATLLPLGDRQRLTFARLASRWPGGVRWLLLDEADGALDGDEALLLHELLVGSAPPNVGLVATSRHPEVASWPGWRRFHLRQEHRRLEEVTQA